jgi:cytochrome c553
MSRMIAMIVACTSAAHSASDTNAGISLAEKHCFYCHGGSVGNGNKGWIEFEQGLIPRISAQPKVYFVKSMNAYKHGTRPDDSMGIVAEQLSDDEIRAIAA